MAEDGRRIAIRQRTYGEILDLSVRVVRAHLGPLAMAWLAGVGPLLALNWWLLAGYASLDFELGFPAWHMIWTTALAVFEAPLATAWMTIYLGDAAFADRPRPRDAARRFFNALPQLAAFQVLLRPFLVFQPYLTEVIVLDRNPMVARGDGRPSTLQRSSDLHRGEGGETLARGIVAAVVGAVLLVPLWLSLSLAMAALVGRWEWDRAMFTVLYPLALWAVMGLLAVTRFLSYLDLRIRREAWDVELFMRDELARWSRTAP